MTQENQSTTQKFNEQLQELLKRLTMVEQRVSNLENPRLMYKPPSSQNYQTIAETLDELYKAVEELRNE